jgi:hypothetical protein
MNLAVLMNWLHDQEDVPIQLANNPAAFGLGYHFDGRQGLGASRVSEQTDHSAAIIHSRPRGADPDPVDLLVKTEIQFRAAPSLFGHLLWPSSR